MLVLTEHAKGAGVLEAYCSGECSDHYHKCNEALKIFILCNKYISVDTR